MRAATEALLAGARANETDAMLVVRDGEVLAEYRKPKLDPDGIEMMSATKSLVALGIGRLIQLRRIKSIDQPVSDFYPEWKQGQKALITIRMLMNHTSRRAAVGEAAAETDVPGGTPTVPPSMPPCAPGVYPCAVLTDRNGAAGRDIVGRLSPPSCPTLPG